MDWSIIESIDFSFLEEYVKVDATIFVVNSLVLSAIGFVMPYILPFLFSLYNKIFKNHQLTKQGKRTFITVLSVIICLATVVIQYDFGTETFWQEALTLVLTLLYYVVQLKGMIQLVYENILKSTGLDEVLERVSGTE